jgi:hypothetical protein
VALKLIHWSWSGAVVVLGVLWPSASCVYFTHAMPSGTCSNACMPVVDRQGDHELYMHRLIDAVFFT